MALHFHEGKGQRCSQKCTTQACERKNFTAQRPRASWNTKANWSENNQSKVFCAPEQGLDFPGIVKNISCCCYEHAGGCQVTASIFGLCALQISSKLVGFLCQVNEKELFDFSETTETRDITPPASSTQLTLLKPLSPANICPAPLLEIMDTFLSEKKMWYLKDQGLMDTFLIPETVLCATAILQWFSVTT